MTMLTARAMWTVAAGAAEIRAEPLPETVAHGHVRIRALYSGLSRGTESLVFAGRVPETEQERMRCPHMAGTFPFPVKYGYSMVGRVEAGVAALVGHNVFVLHPHQDVFDVEESAVTVLPHGLDPRRAVLTANMETALNGLWDAGAGPADRIVVVGAGVVGALSARLAGRLPGADVTLVDIDPMKEALAKALGIAFALPDKAPTGADIVIHASATGAGLSTALSCAGNEATVLDLSWYGAGTVPVALGAQYHAGRLRLISSQVGQVATSRRPRWDYARRKAAAIALLDDPALDVLLQAPCDFYELPARLPDVLAPGAAALCQLIRY